MKKVIALDAMGGDGGPAVVVSAAAHVLTLDANVQLILVGDKQVIQPLIRQQIVASYAERVSLHNASETVEMGELPSNALRSKKDSSMRVALNLVKEGKAHACVSAGNTGALMAIARFVLKTLPGIDRPAIVSRFSVKGRENRVVRVLDLGANIDSTPENLYQFAIMGSSLSSAVDQVANPRVALLNIGEEEMKGNELVKSSAEIFSQSDNLNYVGFIEANKLFDGHVDVVVCDGFVGNVMLKSLEGAFYYLASTAKEIFWENIFTKLLAWLLKPILKKIVKRVDPEQFNGAALLGLEGIVVKSHGSATVKGFAFAIREAILEVDKNIPQRIREQVSSVLGSEE